MPQLIRCTIIGLEPGESLTATLNGVTVEFTTEAAQRDIPAVAIPTPVVEPVPVAVAAPVPAPVETIPAVPVEPVTQVTNPDGNPASENP